jgi:hypothetical protein
MYRRMMWKGGYEYWIGSAVAGSSVEFFVANVKLLSKHSTAGNEENHGHSLAVS